MHGTARQTSGGLKKKDLKYNKHRNIVSKKMSTLAKKEKRLQKAGYITTKGIFKLFKKQSGGVSQQPRWVTIKKEAEEKEKAKAKAKAEEKEEARARARAKFNNQMAEAAEAAEAEAAEAEAEVAEAAEAEAEVAEAALNKAAAATSNSIVPVTRTKLMNLIVDNNYEAQAAVKLHIETTNKINLDEQDPDGYTALMYACRLGYINIVKLLLKKTDMPYRSSVAAKVNLKTKLGFTALMLACEYWGETDATTIVKLLVKAGAHKSIINNLGRTAKYIATKKEYHDIVTLLNSTS
jgi:hypothetical protein